MFDAFSNLPNQLSLVKLLSKYVISIDILHKGTYLMATTITDSGTADVKLPIEDIVYFTEYGTATFPGKFILEHIVNWASDQYDTTIDEILTGIFERNWNERDIEIAFHTFENKINSYITGYLLRYKKDVTFLASTFGQEDNASYLMDISLLQKYIRCKIFKK